MKTPHGTARPAVDEATREADRRRRQSHTDRDAFALDQLAKGKDTETADILAAVVLATRPADQAKTVGRLLGLDPVKTLWGAPDWPATLTGHATSRTETLGSMRRVCSP